MRLFLLLPLAGLLVAPSFAQGDFNLYQAALDGLSLAEAQPLLETQYPKLVDVAAQMDPALTKSGVVLLYDNDPAKPSAFLFCNDRFAGFSAVVSPGVAGRIIEIVTVPNNAPTETYAGADGVTIRYPEAELSLQYWGIATPDSYVSVNYPFMTFTTMRFADRCTDIAN